MSRTYTRKEVAGLCYVVSSKYCEVTKKEVYDILENTYPEDKQFTEEEVKTICMTVISDKRVYKKKDNNWNFYIPYEEHHKKRTSKKKDLHNSNNNLDNIK